MADLFSSSALRTYCQSLLKRKLANLAISHRQLLSLHPDGPSPWTSHSYHAGRGIEEWESACKPKVKAVKSLIWLLDTLSYVCFHLFFKIIHLLMIPLSQFPHLQIKGNMNLVFPSKSQYIPISVIEIQQLDFCLSNNYFNIA